MSLDDPPRALQVGERTLLRRPEPGDEREFLARARASRELHRDRVQPPVTRPQFARLLAHAERPGREIHLLCRRDDGALCGVLSLSNVVRESLQQGQLGYYAFVPYAGLGYMREGVELVLRQAFERLRLHRIEASVQPDNAASLALVRRCGFREEGYSPRMVYIGGRWRDHVRFAIDIDDWRAWRRATGRAQLRARR
jgi:[ribosomal protein S5]-alanine N-acetyltransferase